MTEADAITHLTAMRIEARRHEATAIREHHWADTKAKWRNRGEALDLAIELLRKGTAVGEAREK